jgi:hypothetical protein
MKGEYTNSTFWTVSLLTPREGKGERSTVCKVTKEAAIIHLLDLNAIRRPRRGLRLDTECGGVCGQMLSSCGYVLGALCYIFTFMFTTAHSQLTTKSRYNYNCWRLILIPCIRWSISWTLDFLPSSPSPIPCVT